MWNPSQLLFWYKSLFMLQLMLAEFMFSVKLRPKQGIGWKAPLVILGNFAFSMVLPTFFNALYSMFMFFSMFAVTVISLKLLFDESFKNVLFCALIGYTVQHISSEFYELFNIVTNLNGNLASDIYGSGTINLATINWFVVTIYVWIYGMVYWGSFMLVGKNLNKYDIEKLSASVMFAVGGLIMFIDVIFSSITTYMIPPHADRLSVAMLHIYNIGCCVLAIVISFVLPFHINLKNELNVVREINHKQKKAV